MRRVFLTGFMGSGKTTVGRVLARELGWRFLDLDREIEAAAGRSIPDLFASEGEEGFRRREREALLSARERPGVVSLGGGALLGAGAREVVRGYGPVVYLRARAETLARRLKEGAARRPMLSGPGTLAGRIEALLAAREAAYLEADWVIDTDLLLPAGVAQEIARRLRAEGGGDP